MYKLYSVGDRMEQLRMERCGTLAYICLGLDISPSTETLDFRSVISEVISLITLVENSNLDNL
jgi:hypothetical protein